MIHDKQVDRDWFRHLANREDQCDSVAAAGMAEELGLLRSPRKEAPRVIGRLIELARRSRGYTVEHLAEVADVDLIEIVEIETNDHAQPSVRSIHNLAEALGLPPSKLMELSGLSVARNHSRLREAAVRFAARSETNAALNADEKEALDEFVRMLVESTD